MSDQQEETNMGSSIWQSQSVEAPRISLEFIQHQMQKKRRTLNGERDVFYLVVAGVFATWLVSTFKNGLAIHSPMDIVISLSLLLFSLALACMVLHVRKHVRMEAPATDAGVVGGLAVYRSELERLLQLSRREWQVLFYVAPAYLTLLIGGLIFDQRPGKTMRYGLTVVAGIVSVGFAFWVGRKRSRCLQRDLDAIASLK